MTHECPDIDFSRLHTFKVYDAHDAEELDFRTQGNERLLTSTRDYEYRLREPALWRTRFSSPILSLATRRAGSILVSHASSRFATDVAIHDGPGDLFAFTIPLRGTFTLIQDGVPTTGGSACGLVGRHRVGTRFTAGDLSARTNVFLPVKTVETALAHMLDRNLGVPLDFDTALDWSGGLAASLRAQLGFLIQEFERPDGVADNAVALAAMTDGLVTLALRAARHNYSDQLHAGAAGAAPAYVRRAEEFMRANAAAPIRIAEIALAAGCSVRTLSGVFQHFRGTTPLAALRAIRLGSVHAALGRGAEGETVAAIARRYGFTNGSRFNAAFRRRFREAPSEVMKRAARGAVLAGC